MSLSNGVPHLQELTPASSLGSCEMAFSIQEWIIKAWPNADTHLAFGEVLADAKEAGRKVFLFCCVGMDTVEQRGA